METLSFFAHLSFSLFEAIVHLFVKSWRDTLPCFEQQVP